MIPNQGISVWKERFDRLWTRFASDKVFLSRAYKKVFGRKPQLDQPQTYNEKILWRSLFDHNPIYTELADKYLIRNYVRTKIGEEYLTPLLGVYSDAREIDFAGLPNRFALKCTHDCGSVILCTDKSVFDTRAAVKRLNASLRKDFSRHLREHHYRGISRKILCEQHILADGQTPIEYRFFIFGSHQPVFVIVDEYGQFRRKSLYDEEFRHLPVRRGFPFREDHRPPEHFDAMLRFSKILGDGLGFVRVDWREFEGQLYFGELTFTPSAGLLPFEPESWDAYWGSLWDIGDHPTPLPQPQPLAESVAIPV